MFPFGKSKKKLRKEISELKDQVHELYKLQFREGDRVYINDGERNPTQAFYLKKSYNNDYCYYISKDKDRPNNYISNGVHIKHLSHEPPKKCTCCHQLLKDEKNEK